jgi:EAL domain-containing protein (putative c-di-GMP-specific phosphodiesterase class I)
MIVSLQDLLTALDKDEFVPHFQPIVEMRTGEISGFEVLARWQHPTIGAFLPANLIPLAEEHGLIGSLSSCLFRKALTQFARLPKNLQVSLNLSPIQMRYLSLGSQIEAIASDVGFDLRRLTLEITESSLMTDLSTSRRIAHDLKALGCRLSLDDFGTGYSSLAHLQALPFDELKIDRSFVNLMLQSRESRKIVAATVGLGHSLGLRTVGEGIETKEQADMLIALGCNLGQGWLYGRPGPLSVASAVSHAAPLAPGPGENAAVASLEAFPEQRLPQLQAIYDGAPVGLCFLDCDLRYISLNQKLADMNGLPINAHLGKTVKEMIPASFPQYEPYLMSALQGESISGVEVPRPGLSSEKPAWVSLCSYQPAFDEAHQVIGVSVAVLNITEQSQRGTRNHDPAALAKLSITEEKSRLKTSAAWVMMATWSRRFFPHLVLLRASAQHNLYPVVKSSKNVFVNGAQPLWTSCLQFLSFA